ncbi:RNA 2'-phosphotransferase [candidate division KSB1 bacterium]|nr:RNA 2'-phosphotransferase [candidate division KSB1 bacterium]NIR71184.1 RNA 2'-phosphotransferase [candidate division KSB1 bacterium]NIS26169.1 RNA 2'-phosphotransferase [candidate division KSB1 bacterium]NIT72934.1 RNA 2'-phosphotransferase [candidate division KSB1 bacterium]NIU26816.1 RNA 2'-phosphotransferase [candidate division KSB1 bacterium]
MDRKIVKISKFLSYVLRHRPKAIGLEMNPQGWVSVEDLLSAANKAGVPLNRCLLQEVVERNDKKRFSFSENGRWIRANQGHSIDVDLGLRPRKPPEQLYHGTTQRFVKSIKQKGLLKGNRRHVHLSKDVDTAMKVGQRHGRPVVLTVLSGEMYRAGHTFYLSENGIWLTDCVKPQYLIFPE